MKRKILSFIMLFCLLFSLSACGNPAGRDTSSQKPAVKVDKSKTLGEIFKLEVENGEKQTATLENAYVYAFKHKGTYYRAIATITADAKKAIDELDFDDQNYRDNVTKIIEPLKIDKFENLSEQIPSQKELDKLVGKTGQYLLDHDWYSKDYDLKKMEFLMNCDPFCYRVVFEGHIDEKDFEEFDDSIDILEMKIKSIKFESLGDATKIEQTKE